MKSILNFATLLVLSLGIASCAGDGLEAKKAELEALKGQLTELTTQIKTLEAELIAADPEFAAAAKKPLLIQEKCEYQFRDTWKNFGYPSHRRYACIQRTGVG